MEWNAESVKRNPSETLTGLQELMHIYFSQKNYFNILSRPWPVLSYFVFFDNESWWQLLIFQDWWSFPNSLPTSNFGRKYFSGKYSDTSFTINSIFNHVFWRITPYNIDVPSKNTSYHLFVVSSVLSEDTYYWCAPA